MRSAILSVCRANLGSMEGDSMKVNFERLEKKYGIVITGNKATAFKRGLFRSKPLLTATAFLGTKAIDVARLA
jgi:hypothetical protein